MVKFCKTFLYMDDNYWQIIWFGIIEWNNFWLDLIYNLIFIFNIFQSKVIKYLMIMNKAWYDDSGCGKFKDEENKIHAFKI